VDKDRSELNGHFFHLKRLTRSKSQPLYLYKLHPSDFTSSEGLKEALNIEAREELENTEYILINEDGLRLPMSQGEADAAIAFKFMQNPSQVNNIDDLYELLDLGKGLPIKYFITQRVDQGILGKSKRSLIYKSRLSNQKNDDRSCMSIQQKLLRKFFYENSANIDDLAIIAEITNAETAKKVGIMFPDEMVVL